MDDKPLGQGHLYYLVSLVKTRKTVDDLPFQSVDPFQTAADFAPRPPTCRRYSRWNTTNSGAWFPGATAPPQGDDDASFSPAWPFLLFLDGGIYFLGWRLLRWGLGCTEIAGRYLTADSHFVSPAKVPTGGWASSGFLSPLAMANVTVANGVPTLWMNCSCPSFLPFLFFPFFPQKGYTGYLQGLHVHSWVVPISNAPTDE